MGLWLYTQRRVREGAVRGNLSEEQIQKLDAIGMVWSVERNDRFEEYVEAFIRFKEEYGTCKIPCDYVDSNGLQLGNWAYREKRSYREGKFSEYKVKRLTELGFIWNNYNGQWYKQYEKAKSFYEEHGHLSIPTSYTKEHGGTLSSWLNRQKAEYLKENHGKLTKDQVELLEALEIEYRSRSDVIWMKGVSELRKYVDEYGDALVPYDYVTKEGYNLGSWVKHLKNKYNKGELQDKKIEALNEIGMCWENTRKVRAKMHWNAMYEEAKKFYEEHGHFVVPEKYVTESGVKLYNWIAQQRRIRRGTIKHSAGLSEEKIAKLDALGMNWGE